MGCHFLLQVIFLTQIKYSSLCYSVGPLLFINFIHSSSSVQFSSVTQSCPTLFDPMNCSTPGLLSITNSQSSLRLTSIKSVMPSSHLILCRPLLLLPPNPSQHQSLFQWVNSSHEVAKVYSSVYLLIPNSFSECLLYAMYFLSSHSCNFYENQWVRSYYCLHFTDGKTGISRASGKSQKIWPAHI